MAKEQTDTEVLERPAEEPVSPKVFSRDEIRTAILDSKGESEVLDVFGVQVEVRAPNLEDLLQYRDAATDDNIMARAIVNNVYVPGTDQRVFDDTDIPVLMKTSFTADMKKLNKAVSNILGADDKILAAVDDDTKSHKE